MARQRSRSAPASGESWSSRAEKKFLPGFKMPKQAAEGSTSYARDELYISEYNRHYTLQYNLQSTPLFRGRVLNYCYVLCTFLYCFNLDQWQ